MPSRFHSTLVLLIFCMSLGYAQFSPSPISQQEVKTQIKANDIPDLKMTLVQNSEVNEEIATISNQAGTNNLQHYPVRPEYAFSGPEVIYKLPPMEDLLFLSVGKRVPDIEVDLFILTDPNDANSAVLWLNGTDTKVCFNADPNESYYLVVDGFEDKIASVEFSMSHAGGTVVCDASTAPVFLYRLITTDLPPGGDWFKISGSGGIFDANAGTFTPAIGATTSVFLYSYDLPQGGCETEEVVVTIFDCSIPTIGQWGLIILGLSLLCVGLVFLISRRNLAAKM